MFKVKLTNGSQLENVTFPELVELSDNKQIERFNILEGLKWVCIKDYARTNNSQFGNLNLLISDEAYSKVVSGGSDARYGCVFIPDEEVPSAYCYQYDGHYNNRKDEWYVDIRYPVLSISLSNFTDENRFFTESRTPLTDDEINRLKSKIEKESKITEEQLTILTTFSKEQLAILSTLTEEQLKSLKLLCNKFAVKD